MKPRSITHIVTAVRAGAEALEEQNDYDNAATLLEWAGDMAGRLHYSRKDIADAIRSACAKQSQDGSYQHFWDIANKLDPPEDK